MKPDTETTTQQSESAAPIPADRYDDVVRDVMEYLAFQRDEGIRTFPADRQLMDDLAQSLATPHASATATPQPATPPTPASTVQNAPAPQREKPTRTTHETVRTVSVSEIVGDGDLGDIAQRILACRQCPLHEKRRHPVPGQGAINPDIAFVGEGPGADEDREGIAFIGRAGQLLNRIMAAMGYTREEVWIGNIVKCRPPGNRTPLPTEMETCLPFLREQLAIIQPKVIVCLGSTAVKGLLQVQTGITRLRGTWMNFAGIPVMPTYHPAYLLRNPSAKRDVWNDMKDVLSHLGKEPPPQPRKQNS